jgi:hypothetical protein
VAFWGKLRIKLLLPVLLSLGSVALGVGVNFYEFWKNEGEKPRRKDIFKRLILMLDKVTMLLFTLILSTIASVFDCVKTSDNYYVLRSYPSLNCYSSEWYSRISEISVFIVLYVIIFPLRLCWIFYKMTLDPKLRFKPKYFYLTSGYKPGFFWWDVLLLLKRVVFILFSQFLFSEVDSSLRLICSTLVFIFFATIELMYTPFQFNAMSKNNFTLLMILILLSQGLVFEDGDAESSQIFVWLVIMLFCIITTHTVTLLSLSRFKKIGMPRILIDEMTFAMLDLQTQKELLELWSDEFCNKNGELQFDLCKLHQNEKGFLMKEILQFRRQCDVTYGYSVQAQDNAKDFVAYAVRDNAVWEMPRITTTN